MGDKAFGALTRTPTCLCMESGDAQAKQPPPKKARRTSTCKQTPDTPEHPWCANCHKKGRKCTRAATAARANTPQTDGSASRSSGRSSSQRTCSSKRQRFSPTKDKTAGELRYASRTSATVGDEGKGQLGPSPRVHFRCGGGRGRQEPVRAGR